MEEKFDWSGHVRSVMTADKDIISAIIKLHNHGQDFDLDPTYSKGVFWKGLNSPKLKFDLFPQTEDTVQASADKLPLESESIGSIMFDPPFVVRDVSKPHTGIIANRFWAFKTVPQLWDFYDRALAEFHRVLKKGGIVAFKCQDLVTSGKQWISHFEIMKYAEKHNYHIKDIFILYRGDHVLFSPNMKVQKHARKTHCYFIVLEKK